MSRFYCVFVVLVVAVAVAVVQSVARKGCKPRGTTIPPTTTPTTTEEPRRIDCQEWKEAGAVNSGVYTIWPSGREVKVRCDMETDGGGWTVFQRRGNFSINHISFDLPWVNYTDGFGDLEKEFWLGLDYLFNLTIQGNYSLRMDMIDGKGKIDFAVFKEFRIGNKTTNYTLHVSNYQTNGNAGDSMKQSNGYQFSTKDKDNDGTTLYHCAEQWKGGFWYNFCAFCNPNGLYDPGTIKYSPNPPTQMFYYTFGNTQYGLRALNMKLRRL